MSTLQISPDILQWAAEQSRLSIDALIDLLKCSPSQSKREELKSGKFTLNQLKELADKTHIPFGYFFLDTPPTKIRPCLPDLRQLPDSEPLSNDFFETLDDVLRKQVWFVEYLKGQAYDKLDFVGKFKNINCSIQTVAADIRDTLYFTYEEQKKCVNSRAFFNLLSTKAEDIGILIFKNGVVKNNTRRPLSVAEFRGFAIADEFAPAIFINGKDRETAWVFTLAHELAHIWLGESGVFNLPYEQNYDAQQLEKHCNQIAAELLVPEVHFLAAWESHPEPKLTTLSKLFKVSTWVIARRAYEFNKITLPDYIAILKTPIEKENDESRGGDFYKSLPSKNSKRVTRAIISAAMSGNMMLREAANLLNVQPDVIVQLDKRQ